MHAGDPSDCPQSKISDQCKSVLNKKCQQMNLPALSDQIDLAVNLYHWERDYNALGVSRNNTNFINQCFTFLIKSLTRKGMTLNQNQTAAIDHIQPNQVT